MTLKHVLGTGCVLVLVSCCLEAWFYFLAWTDRETCQFCVSRVFDWASRRNLRFRSECDLDPGPVLVSSLRVFDLAISREHSHWLVGVC